MGGGEMNAATLDALRASIAHWERLAAGDRKEGIKSDDCALCALFAKHCCQSCPVAQATGRRYCYGSPYHKAACHYVKRDDSPKAWGKWIAAAKAELDFLKNLLPKNKT